MQSYNIFTMWTLALISLCLTTAYGHSWIEQLTVVAPNGTFVGTPGYARGNVQRSTPGFSDPTMVNLIPPDGRPDGNQILPTDRICKDTQQSPTQTNGSPALQAAPGSAIALRYQENGHVTLPQNQPGKPANRGTMYVYGTTDPQPTDSLLAIHKVWNADGSGGDKRGVLLSTANFDDGRCYQVNGDTISKQRQAEFPHTPNQLMGADLWCQQDVALPADAPSGKPYTLYWVWDWPTLPGGDPSLPNGKQEIYTTCMDIDVTNDAPSEKATSSGHVQSQDLNSAAIPSEMANLNNPTAAATPSNAASKSSAGSSAASPTVATPSSPGTSNIPHPFPCVLY